MTTDITLTQTEDALERLIARLVQADRSPVQLAADLGLSLQQFAAWATTRDSIATLERLVKLADIRAQLMLSNYRANAAVQLVQIATTPEPSELSRKACVDLLQVNLGAFVTPDEQAAAPETPLNEDAIYRVLDRLGRDEPETPSPHVDNDPSTQR